jgi:hypothetical protein
MTTETRCAESTATKKTLFMALEMGSKTWKVAVATTRGMRPRVRTLTARALTQSRDHTVRLGSTPTTTSPVSCGPGPFHKVGTSCGD